MEEKRQEHSSTGGPPLQKIRKIVNITPGVKELLHSRNSFVEGRLHVRQEGDEVFISLRGGEGNYLGLVPAVPRMLPPQQQQLPRQQLLPRQQQPFYPQNYPRPEQLPRQQQQRAQQQQRRLVPIRSAAGR